MTDPTPMVHNAPLMVRWVTGSKMVKNIQKQLGNIDNYSKNSFSWLAVLTHLRSLTAI